MSRIGKQPITIPSGVAIKKISDIEYHFKGPKGELTQKVHPEMIIEINDKEIIVKRPSDVQRHRALHGLTRALLANAVEGVHKGFEKKMQMWGLGYRAELKGRELVFQLGYSHPINYTPPEGIEVTVEKASAVDKNLISLIKVSGVDKQLVGMVADKIRSFKKPEPYLGKGIRYADEKVRRKAGKTGAK